MKRRRFVTSSLAASSGLLAATTPHTAAAAAAKHSLQESAQPQPEYYELRLYHLRRGPKVKLVDDFFREVALPAMRRAGLGPVGFFNVAIGPDSPTLYMLIPHKSMESFATASARVSADSEYRKAGAAFLGAPAADPAYVRAESSLMVSFEGTKLEVPAPANKGRIFELRTYESHNKAANKKKIEMFAKLGEIAIFRRTGLQPVFFGETLIGSKLPNLTYMLTYPDMSTRDKNWSAFIGDPEWKKLSATPGYTDPEIVTNISSAFLRPTGYSEI
ncbi:MAG: NIPSNAP family protein [Pyrinomonadaceae bacterium]